MNYTGKIYAKIAGEYVELDQTSEDIDKLAEENERLKTEIQELQKGNVANVISVTVDADLCDVNGCGAESSTGGCGWQDTGYWSLCSYHSSQARKGSPQPVMKQSAIAREKSRDPISGLLP